MASQKSPLVSLKSTLVTLNNTLVSINSIGGYRVITLIHCSKRELKKTTTAMGTLLNKRFNEQYYGCACALKFLVHFLAILCKTSMGNDQILCCAENVNHDG